MQFTNVNCESILFFFPSLSIFLCSFLESTYWPTVLHNHQPISSVGKLTFCLCLCAIARFNTHQDSLSIFLLLFIGGILNTPNTKRTFQWFIIFFRIFFFISFFIHLKWAGFIAKIFYCFCGLLFSVESLLLSLSFGAAIILQVL